MKKSERILLVIFTLVFLVVVGGGLLAFGLKNYRELTAETGRLRDRLAEMHQALAESAVWQERSAWLDEKMPRFASRQEASAHLLENLQSTAENAALALGPREFIEPQRLDGEEDAPQGFYDKATVRLTLDQAPENALFTWMHALQSSGEFQGVTRLSITPSGQGKTVNAEIEVTQFYLEKPHAKVTRRDR
ncbi:MAG TPA: hypothetical protein DIT13_14000 [Verrucomicrobiales bacterium]|nr:hypothetical protein [Verrucomicrobiales bacterium]HRJ09546.1 hypothetical protein [Prosthecobacter sp.]HRK14946.1 hypothetical protein [Prosthecobacter sp.]